MSSHKAEPFTTTVREPYPRFRFELMVVAVVVVTGGLVVAAWSRDTWFYTDVWDLLALRRVTDLESIVRPHFGHWQVPAALQTRFLYSIAGMEFWPVHYLPKAIGWAAFSVFSWWLMRRRGAHPAAALGALAVTTVLATSFYFHSAHIGALIAIACALGAGALIGARPEPTSKDRLWLYLMMQLAVMSAGVGVSALLGISLGLLLVRRLRRWVVAVAAAGAIYATWFVVFDVANADAADAARTLSKVPWAVAVNMKNVLLGVTDLPSVLGWPLLVAAIAAVVWLAWKRRLTVFDVLMLVVALVYVGLVSRTRTNLDRGAVATNVILLLTPVFIPFLSLVRRRMVVVTGLVFVALVVSHGTRLESGLDERIAMVDEGRPTIESMAALISRGNTYLPGLRFTDLSGSSQLTLRGLDRLVDEGWDPGPPAAESAAIVRLRVSFFGDVGEPGGAIEVTTGKLRDDGCIIAFDGDPIVIDVTGVADLTIRSTQRTDLAVNWDGDDHHGHAILSRVRKTERELFVSGPPEGATITLDPVEDVGKMLVCGVDRFVES